MTNFDLSSAKGLDSFNKHMMTRSYLGGWTFSEQDRELFATLGGKCPNNSDYPHAYRWFIHIAALTGAKSFVVSESTKKVDDDDDDDLFGDDDDLFGDDDDDEPEVDDRRKRIEEMKKAKKSKKAEKVAKTQVMFEVKPWETETDLVELYKTITSRQQDGLIWGEGYKLAEVAFGIKKLQMSVCIEDDKVCLDDITEPIEGMEDLVQSVDVLTMNRL